MANEKTPETKAAPAKERGLSHMKRSETQAAWLFLAPAAFGLLLFMIVPFLMAFYLSLTNTRLMSPNPPEFVGLSNYQRLLRISAITMQPEVDEAGTVVTDENGQPVYPRSRTILRGNERYSGMQELFQFDLFGNHYLVASGDPTFLRGVLNNFYFVLVVVPVQAAFALLLAMLVNKKMRGVNLFRGLYFTPVVVPMVVVSVIWFFLYNPGVGTINAFIETITFGLVGPQNWLSDPALAFPSIMVLSIWQGVGFQMVIFLAGLQEIPPEIYEASAIDGASKLQEFIYITLPSLRNTTIFVMIATTILAFQLFTQVDIMTGGGPGDATMTTVLHAVNEGRRQLRAGYASAITVLFFIIVLLVSILQRVLVREERAMN